MRYAVLTIALLVTGGCDSILGAKVPFPPAAERAEPLPSYRDWFREVEQDAGLTGDFDRIRWYRVPGDRWSNGDHAGIRGMWVKRGNRIYIAQVYWGDSRVVKHEVLHYLLGDTSHDHPLFDTWAYQAS
jgi:hypothetical protein